jgi:hypothetical protein
VFFEHTFFFFFFFFFLGPVCISSGSTAAFKAYCAFEHTLLALIVFEYYCLLGCDAFSSGKIKLTFQSIQLPQVSGSLNKICTAMKGRYSNWSGPSKVQSKDRQVYVDGLGWTGEMCTVKKWHTVTHGRGSEGENDEWSG